MDKLLEWVGSGDQLRVAEQGLRNQSDKYFTEPVIRIAEIDVDNDELPDKIFFYPHCVFGGSVVNTVTMSSPLIVSQVDNGIDKKATLGIFRTAINRASDASTRLRPDGTTIAVADVYRNSAFGLFRFHGKTYFDFWWDAPISATPTPLDANILRVYLPKDGHARAICAFRVDSVPALKK